MRPKLDAEACLKLAESEDYRSFMRILIEERTRLGFPLSYADISDYAGFKSRSFPRDVILGNKRITLRSLAKFVRGLRLDKDCAALFVALVERESSDCRSERQSIRAVEQKVQRCRSRIARLGKVSQPEADVLLNSTTLPKVYAALRQVRPGDTQLTISRRCRLKKEDVENSLQRLLAAGLAVFDNG
jgi:uncharacterized protein (TIGR02147 family)